MLHTVAIRGYRSLREIVLPHARLTVVTGANGGTGKSSLFDVLRRDESAGFQPAVWAGAVIPRGFLLVPASRIPRNPQATGRLHRLTPPTARRPVCFWLR
jgi:hypothetical protein